MIDAYFGVLIGLAIVAFLGLLLGCVFYSMDEDDKETRQIIRWSLFALLLTPAWPVIVPVATVWALFLLFRFSFRIALDKDRHD